jgi:hypothetical protein
MRQRCSLIIALEFPAGAIRLEKEIKSILTGKDVKLYLFAEDKTLHPKEPKNS